MLGVLLADYDADFALRLRAFDVFRAIDAHKLVAVGVDECVPSLDVAARGRVNIPIEKPVGLMKHRGPGVPQFPEIGLLKGSGVRLPRQHFSVVQRQQPQHVDNRGAAHQIHSQRGILRLSRISEKAETAPVNERRGQSTRASGDKRTTGNHCFFTECLMLPWPGHGYRPGPRRISTVLTSDERLSY